MFFLLFDIYGEGSRFAYCVALNSFVVGMFCVK